MPETCQPQAIVSVQPTVCPIILQIERELALFNSREKLDKTRLPNEWIQRNRDDTMNSSFRRIATTDQTLRSGNLSTRLNIRANKICIYLERIGTLPYATTCIERRCRRCYRNFIWKTSTTNNEEDGRKTKEKVRDRRKNFHLVFFYYLVEYEAARFVDHKQVVDSRCHFCHKTTRELLLLLLLPPRETIANTASEQTTKASGSGTRGAPNPNLLNPNSFPEFIIFIIIICEINLF